MILERPTENNGQCHLLRFGKLIEREDECAKTDVLTHGQNPVGKGAACHYLILAIGNIIGIADRIDIGTIGVHYLNGHFQCIIGRIDKLGEFGQRHDCIAEFPPFLRISIAFLLPMHVQHTLQSRPLTTIVVEGQ